MPESQPILDIWILEANMVYKEVPFPVAVDWLQQGRVLETDKVRVAGSEEWQRIADVPAFTASHSRLRHPENRSSLSLAESQPRSGTLLERRPTPYTAEISRSNPSCFVFLIDQSGSMIDPFGNSDKKKAVGVADAINRLLHDLVLRCSKSEGIRDYYHVGVIGYGSGTVDTAWGGQLSHRTLVPLSELARSPLRVEQRTKKVDDGAGGLVDRTVKFPVWFEPQAEGSTPMCEALSLAHNFLVGFLRQFPDCYPPLVLNISDGEATDGDPEPGAAALRNLSSSDGNVLLFNLDISSRKERPIEFPDREADLPDAASRRLFRMSSVLPPSMRLIAQTEGVRVSETTHGFVFNADLVSVIRFLDIGTRVDAKNLR